MRTSLTAATAAILITGGALAMAPQASAVTDPPGGDSWDHVYTTSDSGHGGTLYIEEYGDFIELCDTKADGLAPRADISVLQSDGNYKLAYQLISSQGNGFCVSHQASDGGVYNLPENTTIHVHIYLGPNGASQNNYNYSNDH